MKFLLLNLKLAATFTLVIPSTLIFSNFIDQKLTIKSSSETLSKNIQLNSHSPVLSSLLNNAAEQQEKFSKFKSNSNLGDFNNDNSGLFGTNDRNGAPYDRFGGGLFFDYTNFNSQAQAKIGQNIFGTFGYASIQNHRTDSHEVLDHNKIMPLDYYATEHDGPVSEGLPGAYRQSINYDFTSMHTPNSDVDPHNQLSTNDDLDLTPTYIQRSNLQKISQTKKMFLNLFNDELYYWYWQIWGSTYSDYTYADQNETRSKIIDNSLIQGHFIDTPKLNLSISYNKLESKHDAPSPAQAAEAATLGVLSGLVNAAFDDLPGIGEILGVSLGFLISSLYSKSAPQLIDYYSPALDYSFWSNFFAQYLGVPIDQPGNHNGLINQFVNQYHQTPSTVTMNDFDFYIPYSSIKINSKFVWKTLWTKLLSDNYSSSNINLSNLILNMGTSFTLHRIDSSLADFLQQLKAISPQRLTLYTSDLVKNPDGNYYSSNDHNGGMIQDRIEACLPSQGAFIDGLSFTGQMKLKTTSNIEVYYNNVDQHMTLPIKLIKF